MLDVTVCQFAPFPDVAQNLSYLQTTVADCASGLVVLPENCLFLGEQSGPRRIARPLAEWHKDLASVAAAAKAVTIFGGIPVRRENRVTNTSVAVSADGEILATYDKIHLFQLFTAGDSAIDETNTFDPGDWQPTTFVYDGWRIGLSVCYDLRFPELYQEYLDCDAIICTAAFTRHTGRAHWEILCRARAIENQCWFIGAGACGENQVTGHQSWGHSLIVDPWGRIVSSAEDRPAILSARLSKDKLIASRKKLPALQSRRASHPPLA